MINNNQNTMRSDFEPGLGNIEPFIIASFPLERVLLTAPLQGAGAWSALYGG